MNHVCKKCNIKYEPWNMLYEKCNEVLTIKWNVMRK